MTVHCQWTPSADRGSSEEDPDPRVEPDATGILQEACKLREIALPGLHCLKWFPHQFLVWLHNVRNL